ncbi:MAG: serine hydrolase [Planctomycetales bacterium]|nr:serine hydrolase [Planctomycetales bacterium]
MELSTKFFLYCRHASYSLMSARFLFAVVATLYLSCLSPVAHGDDLAEQLTSLIDAHEGDVSVAVKHLETGESFEYRADVAMPTASLIKFPLMVAAYQAVESGQLQLAQNVTLRKEDKVPGSGILTPMFSEGTQFSLRDAIHLMMVYSDNTATNLVIDQVGLPATASLMESLGCKETKLHSKVFQRETSIFPERSKQFGLGSTTAREMVHLLGLLHAGELVSKDACQKMLAHMQACDDRGKLVSLLPAGTKVAHKGGAVSASRCDSGIIFSPNGPLAVSVLTTNNEDRSWGDENAAHLLCANIAKAVYDHFNSDSDTQAADVPQKMKVGASGKLVEALQRTLNARMQQSMDIGVDGDFGSQTERAVMAFQRERKLPETGEVGPETWAALGTLILEGPAIDEPAVINAMKIEKQPADDLTGEPFVTCKAWAIGDGKTGKLLWGYEEETARDIASTTKMLTGFLVTSLAEKQPEVLDEVVVFSERADQTLGSTAGVNAGEKLPVKELLFGLLLPSGNDASVALAEQFGTRLGKTKEGYDGFIEAMNLTAKELGMNVGGFVNPHGLPAEGHQSCARDLMTLAYHAMQQPLFREYVNTPQRGCKVIGPEGYSRNLLWKNTNRLLQIEGYDGVKTGTTNAAGSCLVSHRSRGDHSLIVVVLGATSTDARYVDTRNLFRWAWNQLEAGQP